MPGPGRATQRSRDRADPEVDRCDTLDTPVDPDPPLCSGDTVDRYRIVRLIATGGMARVYEATHEWTHRSVALKIMHARFGCRSDLVERFRKEALALSAIAHPNVVGVENGGLTRDGFVFLATEMLQGQSLRQVLRERKRLPIRDALEVVIQVARGVAAAHAQNVIHRDLKPENIFCTKGGVVKVLDLGIAKLIGYDAKETDPNLGFVAGTPAYMAPEILEAQPVDVTADVYALGVITYECIAGRHPLTPDGVWPLPAELVRRALALRPPPLLDVPPELSELVERALHKNAARRHASMAQLLADLEKVKERCARNEALASPPSVRPSRKRRALSALVLVAALALGVASLVQHAKQSARRTTTPLAFVARPSAKLARVNTSSFSSSTHQTSAKVVNVTRAPPPPPANRAPPRVQRRARPRSPSRLIARRFDAQTQASPAQPAGVPPRRDSSR